ncbi:heptaprenyl diphosphate synthase component II [Bacillus taeanensis]|uniref:Heptaprenyl diphosphate synthase component 2 n=1 Tax=Bacillus taeanensis TaxID=273032 RepID=A0A366Y1J8_9BACI|nr:heptaprenyl diphosphate synthase component II [Bacillus taeanensis]RBW70284.1 heptaprenyl diphosphate synthase component II [Bacillus taeanensis]
MKLTTLYASLRSDLSYVEKELEKIVEAKHPILQQASFELLKAGGKRIRPGLVLLSAKFGHYDIEEIKKVAVTLELIHTASLVHDDVIDDAETRRGKQTVKAKWDNKTAMYTGDYLFAKAIEYITLIEKPEAHQLLSRAIHELTIGEIEQIRYQFVWDQNLRHYLRRIKRKTALLIAISCQLGALASDAAKEIQLHLYRFGYFVGMAFQITDDILDYTGTEKEIGKPAGGDLKQGHITLPVLYALSNEEIRTAILPSFKNGKISNEDLAKVLDIVKQSGGIAYSKKISDRYLQKAYEELEYLPNIPAKKSLIQIAQYIGSRKF